MPKINLDKFFLSGQATFDNVTPRIYKDNGGNEWQSGALSKYLISPPAVVEVSFRVNTDTNTYRMGGLGNNPIGNYTDIIAAGHPINANRYQVYELGILVFDTNATLPYDINTIWFVAVEDNGSGSFVIRYYYKQSAGSKTLLYTSAYTNEQIIKMFPLSFDSSIYSPNAAIIEPTLEAAVIGEYEFLSSIKDGGVLLSNEAIDSRAIASTGIYATPAIIDGGSGGGGGVIIPPVTIGQIYPRGIKN